MRLSTNYTKDTKQGAKRLSCFSCISWMGFLLVLTLPSCSSKPIDVRTVVPADALVYLETQDLGKALQAVTDNDAFRAAAKLEPDFSALNGIKVAVAVTGFETKDLAAADGSSELSVQPRFVAVAETNAWNYQAIKFAENKLGEFVNDIYGGGVELERFPRYDGDYFVWTADDGRKAYGLVIGSLIFFGNDETAIEKCVAVRKGEGESIAKNQKLLGEDLKSSDPNWPLAAGFISEQGLAQISNLVGVQVAMGSSEEGEVRSFVARVLPEVARNSIKGAKWTTFKSDDLGEMVDHFQFDLDPELGRLFEQKLRPTGGQPSDQRVKFIPVDASSISSYTIDNTGEAWESVVANSQRNLDPVSSGLISTFADSLFDAYAIDDPTLFLKSVSSGVLTARLDAGEDSVVVVAETEDLAAVKKAIAKEISFSKPPQKIGDVSVWRSDDGDVAFANVGRLVVSGDAESVSKAIEARASGNNYADKNLQPPLFTKDQDLVLTVSRWADPDARIVQVLGQRKDDNPVLRMDSRVSTVIGGGKLLRGQISKFGLIGSIIEQFAKDQ